MSICPLDAGRLESRPNGKTSSAQVVYILAVEDIQAEQRSVSQPRSSLNPHSSIIANMKPSATVFCLMAALGGASPMPQDRPQGFEAMGRLSRELGKRQFDISITRNELGECKPVTVIFARGTTELGNVGSITGPPFFNALDVLLGADKVGVQGVDYPATIAGYLEGGDKGGAQTLADLTNQAASQCPDTQIVLSGYSQGAQVVHLGEAEISPETASRVAAVVCVLNPYIRIKSAEA